MTLAAALGHRARGDLPVWRSMSFSVEGFPLILRTTLRMHPGPRTFADDTPNRLTNAPSPPEQSPFTSPAVKGPLRRYAPLTPPPAHYIGTYGEPAHLWSGKDTKTKRVVLLFQVKTPSPFGLGGLRFTVPMCACVAIRRGGMVLSSPRQRTQESCLP